MKKRASRLWALLRYSGFRIVLVVVVVLVLGSWRWRGWPNGQGKAIKRRSFAGTAGKRPRTMKKRTSRLWALLRYSDLPIVLVVVVVLGWWSWSGPELRGWPKDKGKQSSAGVSLLPPGNDRERRTTTKRRTIIAISPRSGPGSANRRC
jgi:hypothetical protein